jgi:hypothetical protein
LEFVNLLNDFVDNYYNWLCINNLDSKSLKMPLRLGRNQYSAILRA